jgi:cell division transport system permease protein
MRTWLRLHVLALRAALARMAAQPWSAAMSILVLGVALALPILAAVLLRTVGTVAASLDTEPHANVYLSLDAGDEDVKRVGEALRAHPEARSVRFISRTQALEELKATTHLADLLAAIDRNPLPHAFTVRLRSAEAARLEAARIAWSALPKVDQVASDFEWAARLARWVRFGDRLLAAVAIALALAVGFIIGHLIRLQVLTRREEIQVSQLIGATAADVRRPFLYHGALQGAAAGLAGLGLGALAVAWIGHEVSALAPAYATELKAVFLGPLEGIATVAGAAALGLLGSLVAVRRELTRFSAAP